MYQKRQAERAERAERAEHAERAFDLTTSGVLKCVTIVDVDASASPASSILFFFTSSSQLANAFACPLISSTPFSVTPRRTALGRRG